MLALSAAIDLAVLKLDDGSFLTPIPALPMRPELPEIQQTVFAYGYPEGGIGPVDHPGYRVAA